MRVPDGNESDKTINRNLIQEMMERMRHSGEGRFVYVPDASHVTEENLDLIDDRDDGGLFVPDTV